jgi:hypothetical protein
LLKYAVVGATGKNVQQPPLHKVDNIGSPLLPRPVRVDGVEPPVHFPKTIPVVANVI